MAGVSSRWRSNGRRPRPFRAWLGPGSRRPGWGRCPRASSAFPPFSARLSPSCPLPAAAEAERCGEYGAVWGRGWLAPGGEAAGGSRSRRLPVSPPSLRPALCCSGSALSRDPLGGCGQQLPPELGPGRWVCGLVGAGRTPLRAPPLRRAVAVGRPRAGDGDRG